MDIKSIETLYAGHRFRSRLEARWAVFFDAVGAKWEYEPQGYEVNGIPYLPDFLLPDLRTFVEVKGDPDQLDVKLLGSLAAESAHFVLVLGGIPKVTRGRIPMHLLISPIWDFRNDLRDYDLTREASFAIERLEDPADRKKVWAFIRANSAHTYKTVVHHECLLMPLKDGGVMAMSFGPANMPRTKEEWLNPAGYPLLALLDPSVEAAYDAARQARFEHGETPA